MDIKETLLKSNICIELRHGHPERTLLRREELCSDFHPKRYWYFGWRIDGDELNDGKWYVLTKKCLENIFDIHHNYATLTNSYIIKHVIEYDCRGKPSSTVFLIGNTADGKFTIFSDYTDAKVSKYGNPYNDAGYYNWEYIWIRKYLQHYNRFRGFDIQKITNYRMDYLKNEYTPTEFVVTQVIPDE